MINLENDGTQNRHISQHESVRKADDLVATEHSESSVAQFMHKPFQGLPRVEFGACASCGKKIPKEKKFCGVCSLRVVRGGRNG